MGAFQISVQYLKISVLCYTLCVSVSMYADHCRHDD